MIGTRTSAALLLVIALLTLAFRASAGPMPVTARDLLTAPEHFDGKRVFVRGYYIGTFGESRLFVSKCAADSKRNAGNIWIDQSIWGDIAKAMGQARESVAGISLLGISNVEDLTKHCVQLIGTFRIRRANGWESFGCAFDWTGSSPYALTNVTYFRPIMTMAICQHLHGFRSTSCTRAACQRFGPH
jgi:hypothetical protein